MGTIGVGEASGMNPNLYALNILRGKTVLLKQLNGTINCWMCAAATGVLFDGNAWLHNVPRTGPVSARFFRSIETGPIENLKKPLVVLKHTERICAIPLFGEHGSHEAFACTAPHMHGLGHGAKIGFDACCTGCGQGQSDRRLLHIEAQEFRASRCRAKHTQSRRWMPALGVVMKIDRHGQFGLHLKACDIGHHQVFGTHGMHFCQCKKCGQDGRRGVPAHGVVAIIKVECMGCGSIDIRRIQWAARPVMPPNTGNCTGV